MCTEYSNTSMALRIGGCCIGPVLAKQLVGYMDLDWTVNAGDRRSTSEYAFSLGSAAVDSSTIEDRG